jgi:signal transduction histidine kinase
MSDNPAPGAASDEVAPIETYDQVLAEYVHSGSEAALYQASLLSQSCIVSGLGPEDIVALHFDSLEKVLAQRRPLERVRLVSDAQQFLLEVMIAYGVQYREYLELKLQESLRDAESRAALDETRVLDAERLDRERSELLAIIAHELRTPLTAALGSLDLANRSLERGRTERVPPLLGSAREAMRRLSRLSADLVEASRGTAPELRFGPLDLCEVVTQACAWAESAAAEKSVTLVVEQSPTPIAISADSDALLSVLGNLLSNAIRYTPTGGRAAVRLGRDQAWAWVEVADTGIGMTDEVRTRIFEKFYRAPEARSVEAQGLGLGLALVRQLVDGHGGRVEVESALGEGSTFRVLLPLQAPSVREGQSGSAP